MIFALGGNPNSGKTTLFNVLTGSSQHVGNFPGVTIEGKMGRLDNHSKIDVMDLPGIYSLSPYSNEEKVARDYVIQGRPDLIVNIVDATNIERNLYLTLQLLELDIPMVVALNMMDEIRASNTDIDTGRLRELLGVNIIPISAAKNEGIDKLIETSIYVAQQGIKPIRNNFSQGDIKTALDLVIKWVSPYAKKAGVPPVFVATKLIEGDELIADTIKLDYKDRDIVEGIALDLEDKLSTDRESALADMRYSFIEEAVSETVIKRGESKRYELSEKIDMVLTDKFFAIPIFFCVMFLIFYLTFGPVGGVLSDILTLLIDSLSETIHSFLVAKNASPIIISLVVKGIFTGVGSVVSFLPVIIVLFFCLSILEDSGYMARVAFILDKLIRKIGLSGKSVVPMLIGFGCSVPAVMACRTLSSDRDRDLTVLLIPFMSCSAKLPIYAVFTMTFFSGYRAVTMLLLYVLSMVFGIATALIFKKTVFKGEPMPFVMELPNYRMPSLKNTRRLLWERAKDFITRAFTVIFVASLIIWFLESFDSSFNLVTSNEDSMLAHIGMYISPIFKPLGFGDWRAVTSLISGFSAKEALVSTFAVLMKTNIKGLPIALESIFTPLSAMSYLVFVLLYTPCMATVATIKRELNSGVKASLIVIYQCAIAWIAAFLVYNIGGLFF